MTENNEALFSKMSVGERVRYAMEVRGIKQTELAAKIGVGQAAISNIVPSLPWRQN